MGDDMKAQAPGVVTRGDEAGNGDLPGAALQLVMDRHGVAGAQAVATFMAAMGASSALSWEDPGQAANPWVPCDFVMQMATEAANG